MSEPSSSVGRLRSIILATALTALTAALAYGIFSNRLFSQDIWIGTGLKKFIVSVFAFFLFSLVCYFVKRAYFHLVLIGGLLLLAIGACGFGPIISTVFFLVSSYLLGSLFLDLFRVNEPDFTDDILATLVGISFYLQAIWIAAHFQVNYRVTYAAVFLVPFFFNRSALGRLFDNSRRILNGIVFESRTGYAVFSLVGFIVFCILMLALKPEAGFDALSTHLALPGFVSYFHKWTFDFDTYAWAVMPLGGDWAFNAVYMLGGEYAVLLLNFSFMLAISSLIYVCSRRFVSRTIALLLLAAFLSAPQILMETSALFIDNILCLFLLSVVVTLDRYLNTRNRMYLYVLSILMGVCMTLKIFSLFIVGGAIAILFLDNLKNRRGLKTLLVPSAIFLSISTVPYAYAYIMTGNPVFPFMNAFFKSPFYESRYSFNNALFNIKPGLLTLYDVTINSHKYLESMDGALGFQYLVFLPLCLLVIKKGMPSIFWISLALSLIHFTGVFFIQSYIRYIYPSVALFMIMISILFYSIRNNPAMLRAFCLILVLITGLNIYFMPSSHWLNRKFFIDILFDEAAATRYISEYVPERILIEHHNLNHSGENVAVLTGRPFIAGIHGNAYTNSWLSNRFFERLNYASTADQVAALMKEYSIYHFMSQEDNDSKSVSNAVFSFLSTQTNVEFRVGNYIYSSSGRQIPELVANNDFGKGLLGWDVTGEVEYEPKSNEVKVTDESYLVQKISVDPKNTYKYSISAREVSDNCSVRMQVNWHKVDGERVGVTIIPRKCTTSLTTFSTTMHPPEAAEVAYVYVTSHSKTPVWVKSVSFTLDKEIR